MDVDIKYFPAVHCAFLRLSIKIPFHTCIQRPDLWQKCIAVQDNTGTIAGPDANLCGGLYRYIFPFSIDVLARIEKKGLTCIDPYRNLSMQNKFVQAINHGYNRVAGTYDGDYTLAAKIMGFGFYVSDHWPRSDYILFHQDKGPEKDWALMMTTDR